MKEKDNHSYSRLEIAIIGMSGRFPGAKNIDRFWNNLKNGVESITFFSNEELKRAAVSPQILGNQNYVKAGSILNNIEYFDSAFFGYTAKEAELMDPQMRIFYECVYEALEDAGYANYNYDGLIGAYAGASISPSWGIRASSGSIEWGGAAASSLIHKDSIVTRMAYKLDLKGPAVSLRTACSTSLVAIHMACRGLLTKECDIALAGGVNIHNLNNEGYMYHENYIVSPDGHCRAFDAKANGSIFGNGAGVVVLKKLKNAVKDRDHIYAVIKGSAINNDGYRRVSFTAPSVEGQADVIRSALKMSGVNPESISYIEAHGTATNLGDPIEIEALKSAFATNKKNFCALGSVKSNVGHLEAAAGVTGVIKTVMALKSRLIPPSLHFETANPEIDFENSPFYVNTELCEWNKGDSPLRAGVSAFGIGGTNAHMVLEEWPETQSKGQTMEPDEHFSRGHQLILLSAKTKTALDQMTQNLVNHFKKNPKINLANAAYTLQVGRNTFKNRRMLLCSDADELIRELSSPNSNKVLTRVENVENRLVVFMFPGLGSQYVNMGRELYQKEPLFRDEMDRCFEILKPLVNHDIKEVLYPSPVSNRSNINQIEISQVIIFIFEYALAQLLMKWGIKPQAMIGYSFGEYAAACIAGVFSLEDALKLVAARGKLIQKMPPGAMLSVPLSIEELTPLLNHELSVAIDNGPSCIVAGSKEAVDTFENQMKKQKILCMRVPGSRAIHSKMMEPAAKELENTAGQLVLNEPQIPYISNLTGDWSGVGETVEPAYWANHLKNTVQFAAGMKKLVKEKNAVFIEIGPGRDLSALIMRCIDENSNQKTIDLVRPSQKEVSDVYFLLNRIGRLWLYGVKIDWNRFHTGEKRYRISLPGYWFERQRYWIEGTAFNFDRDVGRLVSPSPLNQKKERFYVPSWKPSSLPLCRSGKNAVPSCCLVFINESGFASQLVRQLREDGTEVFCVKPGPRFRKKNDLTYFINPGQGEDYHTLMTHLGAKGRTPGTIIHLWGMTGPGNLHQPLEFEPVVRAQELGLYSLVHLAHAIGRQEYSDKNRFQIKVVTDNMQKLPGEEVFCPEKSLVQTAVKMIPGKYPNMKCSSIDVVSPGPGTWQEKRLIAQLLSEFKQESPQPFIVYRGDERLVRSLEPVPLANNNGGEIPCRLKKSGVYLITGGLEGSGFDIAHYLARTLQPKLVMIENHREAKVESPTAIDLKEEVVFLNKMEEEIEKRPGVNRIQRDQAMEKTLDRLCSSGILDYFKSNSINIGVGKTYGMEELKRKLKILPKFNKFYDFFITALSEDKIIKTADNEIEFLNEVTNVKDFSAFVKEAEEKYPQFKGTIRLIEYCQKNYSKALTGEIEAISVLYPGGDYIQFEEKYQNQAEYSNTRLYVSLLQEFISDTLRKSKSLRKGTRRTFRILEIGGGKGLLTGVIFPGLTGEDVEYHFTDIGSFFVINARKEAEKRGFTSMKFGTLDITKNPVDQGYEYESFDMILGMNVVHAVKDIKASIGNLKQLLVPNGIMCLIEITNPDRWLNMIDGLAEGWWYFEDTHIRENSPLLSLNAWEEVFARQGFRHVTAYPQSSTRRVSTDCGLIIAHQESEKPFQTDWEKNRTGNLRRLEKAGAEVKVIEADVTDLQQMLHAVTRVEAQWGQFHGVIHHARVPRNGLESGDPWSSPGMIEQILAPGIKSTLVLDNIFKEKPLDFFVLISSPDPVNAPAGTMGSCAAAIFFDSFAHHKSSGNGGFVASIKRDADGDSAFSDLFGLILDHSFTRVVVSNGELPGSNAPTGEPGPGHLFTREPSEKNGPLDMKYQRSELSSEYVAPRNALENVITRIWQEFLGMEQVGIEDDFFELRSDSLVFITIAAKIHKAMNVKVPIDVFFSKPTIKELAEYINDAREEVFTSIESKEKKEYYVPSPAQTRLFVLHQLESENTNYNIPLVLYLENAGKAKLEKAFIKLIQRHDSLRTSFHMIEGQLLQKVREAVEFTCQYSTTQSTTHDDQGKINMEIEAIISNIMRPFDLSCPPLMRVRLVKLSETRDLLAINLHHIIADGISQTILVRDFMKLYPGKELPSMRLQYKDYSEWWNLEKQQELMKQQETYWLKTFETGIPIIRLPLDSPTADTRDSGRNVLTFEIDTRDTLALKKVMEKEGMTLTIPILAIYYVLLAKYSGQEDLIIGIAAACRTHADLQNIVGMFVNMLPVRNQPSEDKTFASFLNEVNENVLKAYENQDYPYEELIKKLELQRSPGRDPLISACFTRQYLDFDDRNHDMEKEELQVSLHPYEGKTAIFLLNLEFVEKHGMIKLRLRYFDNLFKESTILTIIRHYREVLKQVLENMNIKLKNIKIASNLTSTKKNILPDFDKDFDF